MSKKSLLFSLKVTISVGFIVFLIYSVDLGTLFNLISQARLEMVALAVLSVIIQAFVAALRWHTVMRAIEDALSYMMCSKLYFIGLFFNQILPSSIGGDAVRIYQGYKSGMALKNAIHSVMLERGATMIGLVIIFTATITMIPKGSGFGKLPIGPSFLGLLVFGAISAVIVLTNLDKIAGLFRHAKFLTPLIDLSQNAQKLFFSFKYALGVLIWSSLGHVFIIFCIYFLSQSLNLDVQIEECAIVTVFILLVMMLPISIAGWGVREGGMISAFSMIAIGKESALAVSLMFGVISLLMALPGGIMWLTSNQKIKVPENLDP